MNRKKEQIQERQESGKGFLCWRSQADSVARLERKVFASSVIAVCAAPSHVGFVKTPELKRHCFYKKSSGYFIFFPASGNRNNGDGKLYNSGGSGYGWTSTPNGSNAWNLDIWSTNAHMNSNNRGNGFPVRCVQASAPVFVFIKDMFCFFPAAGVRRYSDGVLYNGGVEGDGWTSTPVGSNNAYRFGFNSGVANMGNTNRTYGFPVRCVQASAAVFAFTNDTFVFFPASGHRSSSVGSVYYSGSRGYVWTSVPYDSNRAYYLVFYSGGTYVDSDGRIDGRSVRCVQASAAVFVFANDTFVFFPASGFRHYSDGKLYYSGTHGFGWTSTPNGSSFAWSLDFLSGSVLVYSNFDFSDGFPVRCVQGSAAVWAVRKKNIKQIRYRRESGKACLCRRGQADSVTRLRRKVFACENLFVCAASSYLFWFIKLPVFKSLYFYKHSSGYFLFFPATGFHMYNSGVLSESGGYGGGWSSTPSGGVAWNLSFRTGFACVDANFAAFGRSVRCVQASAVVFVFTKDTSVFFPASGIRSRGDGNLADLGKRGLLWTATAGSGRAALVSVGSGGGSVYSDDCKYGLAVRCVQASAPVFAFIKETFVFFPASGFREYSDGSLRGLEVESTGWSSTSDGANPCRLLCGFGYASVYGVRRDYGFPVRCVQASAPVFAFIKETFVFFPASGYRRYSDGILSASGTWGHGWTASPSDGDNAWFFRSSSGVVHVYGNARGHGFPVRCVQASAAVFSCIENDLKQIRYRRESGKARLCRRGQADSVTRLGRKVFASENLFVCAASSYLFALIQLPVFKSLYFYKHSSGYFLFFPAAGLRHYSDGSLRISGGEGDGWTSTPYNSDNAYRFILNSGNATMGYANRTYGFPVRCVQASAPVFAFTKDTSVFFPASGYRLLNDGSLRNSGTYGYGWTSTPDGSGGSYLYFFSAGAYMSHYDRDSGRSVRCVQVSAPVFVFTKDTFIFFPATGFRFLDARLYNVGTEGHGWTSTSTGSSAWHYGGSAGGGALAVHSHEFGFPVRCVQASAAVFVYVGKDIEDTFVFFPASGNRDFSGGHVKNSGVSGYAWTSMPDGRNACNFDFYAGWARVGGNLPSYGFSVRCVQASAAVFSCIENDLKQIRYRRESGKGILCRRGQADSVTRLRCKVFASENLFICAASSYLFPLIKLPVLEYLYFCKHSSGYFLFFPAAGYRSYSDGSLRLVATNGFGWSSTPGGDNAWYMEFYSGNVRMLSRSRVNGFSVRCVQAFAAVFAFTNDTFVFFPASGSRHSSGGSLYNSGSGGYGWASDPYDTSRAWALFFGAGGANMYYDSRAYGFPVRCVQASATVFAFIKETSVFFPASGVRSFTDGVLYNGGVEGCSWTSVPYDANLSLRIRSYSGKAFVAGANRTYGFSVRCVQASATVFVFTKDTSVFFPAAGFRGSVDGNLRDSGSEGDGWTSTVAGGEWVYHLRFLSGTAHVFGNHRTPGFPVRCVQASATVFSRVENDLRQIRYRRESGKARLCRRGQADSVTRLGHKLSASENRFVCAVPSYSIPLIKLPVFDCLYFYKHSSGYFLSFPASGYRDRIDGRRYLSGSWGYGWTSTVYDGELGWDLNLSSGRCRLNYDYRGNGLSVRCVQASAPVFVLLRKITSAYFRMSVTQTPALFFPVSGIRNYSDGSLRSTGTHGYGWTSTPNDSWSAWDITTHAGGALLCLDARGFGFSVRCVQASAIVFVCMVLLLKINAMENDTS